MPFPRLLLSSKRTSSSKTSCFHPSNHCSFPAFLPPIAAAFSPSLSVPHPCSRPSLQPSLPLLWLAVPVPRRFAPRFLTAPAPQTALFIRGKTAELCEIGICNVVCSEKTLPKMSQEKRKPYWCCVYLGEGSVCVLNLLNPLLLGAKECDGLEGSLAIA